MHFHQPIRKNDRQATVDRPRNTAQTEAAIPGSIVQCKIMPGEQPTGKIHEAAREGITSSGSQLPHFKEIQASFGPDLNLSSVKAHVGGPASLATQKMGAEAFATGDHVAFRAAPSRWLAAHEAAHVVQQRHGINPEGGVGKAGDAHEKNADAVADRVVQGRSAQDLLAPQGSSGTPRSVQPFQSTNAVQRKIQGLTDVQIQAEPWWDKFKMVAKPKQQEQFLKLAEENQNYTMGDALTRAGINPKAVPFGVRQHWTRAQYTFEVEAPQAIPANDIPQQPKNKVKPKPYAIAPFENVEEEFDDSYKDDDLGYKYYEEKEIDKRTGRLGRVTTGAHFANAQLGKNKKNQQLAAADRVAVEADSPDDIGLLSKYAEHDKDGLKKFIEKERQGLRVTITKDGLFVWASSQKPVNVENGVFVTLNGENYIFEDDNDHKHTSLSLGQGVFMAGTMRISQGVLEEVSNASGHYQPDTHQLQRFVRYLKAQGVPLAKVAVMVVQGGVK